MISVGGVGGASETANQRGENPAATLLPTTCVMSQICTQTNQREDVYIYAFSRRFNPKWLTAHSGYTFIISTCVPWESNPQPFALLTQCSTTEPQEHWRLHHNQNKREIIINKWIHFEFIKKCVLHLCMFHATGNMNSLLRTLQYTLWHYYLSITHKRLYIWVILLGSFVIFIIYLLLFLNTSKQL